jgi:hypothetical protein
MSDLSDAAVTDARIGDVDMIVFLFFVATFVTFKDRVVYFGI